MKKAIKVVLVCFCIPILMIIIVLVVCQPKSSYNTNRHDYGAWDKPTLVSLEKFFHNSLPDQETVREYGCYYHYEYRGGIGNDTIFVIYVVLQFPDEASYAEAVSKYIPSSDDCIIQGNTTYYPIQYSQKSFAYYADNQVNDGLHFWFEIISANPDDLTVSFINSEMRDYYESAVLIDYLKVMEGNRLP